MYYVYVIKSVDKSKIYIGYTANLKKRLVEHNSGCVRSTKQCNDWDVIYAEDYKDRLLAMKRERFFKTGDGRKVLKFKGILR